MDRGGGEASREKGFSRAYEFVKLTIKSGLVIYKRTTLVYLIGLGLVRLKTWQYIVGLG
jgi:hypothetical protein